MAPSAATLLRPKSHPPPATSSHAVGDQLVDEVWLRSRSSLPVAILVFVVSLPIVGGPLEKSHAALAVYVSFLVITSVRWVGALWAIPRLGRLAPATKHRLALGGALASGCAFGVLNVLIYLHTDPMGLGLWIAIVTGLTGGAAVSLGARPEVFAAYTIPTIAPLVVASLVWWRPGITALAICWSLWIAYLMVQVLQYRKSRTEFIEMNVALEKKNGLLVEKNRALEEMTQRADRIFSALAKTLPGRTLASRYKLESAIGSGGFSIVFQATHTEIKRRVAVKIFRPKPGNDSAAALERFRFEGAATSRTRHPNLVEVFDAGISEDGIPFIAMELLDGRSLDAELRDGARIPLPRACALLAQACRGLAAAHAAGVIHRDVKPENIFVHHEAGREIVKVLDFGIAKVTDATPWGATDVTGSALLGTPHYMAPERLLGQACTKSADAYSVGIILYRALTGELPYQGTIAEVMMRAVSGNPPDLRNLAPEVPASLAAVVRASLSDDPEARPTVAAIADALDAVTDLRDTAEGARARSAP